MKKNPLYIIFDEELLEYANKLMSHMSKEEFDVTSCHINDYCKMKDATFADEAKFIFLGPKSHKQSDAPKIQTWQYKQFGCQIGWTKNMCVLFASDLPFSDYKAFRCYCKEMYFEHDDVILPPETLVDEGVEWLKNPLKCGGIQQSQYRTLIYEFMDTYLEQFICNKSYDSIRAELEEEATTQRKKASATLSMKQKILCNTIIHAATMSSVAIAFIPIPVADAIPMTAVQASMIVALGKVFDNKLTKSDAQIILKAAAAPLAGRVLVKTGLTFVPGVGWAINGVIAGAITEILGWTIANDFATKMKNS